MPSVNAVVAEAAVMRFSSTNDKNQRFSIKLGTESNGKEHKKGILQICISTASALLNDRFCGVG